MPRIKHDASNTLLVVGTPDGQRIRAVNVMTVKFWLDELDTYLLVSKQAGASISADNTLDRVNAIRHKLNSMYDPTEGD